MKKIFLTLALFSLCPANEQNTQHAEKMVVEDAIRYTNFELTKELLQKTTLTNDELTELIDTAQQAIAFRQKEMENYRLNPKKSWEQIVLLTGCGASCASALISFIDNLVKEIEKTAGEKTVPMLFMSSLITGMFTFELYQKSRTQVYVTFKKVLIDAIDIKQLLVEQKAKLS